MDHGTKDGRCDVRVQRVVWITIFAWRNIDGTHTSQFLNPILILLKTTIFIRLKDI
jgi:hypothetical protein